MNEIFNSFYYLNRSTIGKIAEELKARHMGNVDYGVPNTTPIRQTVQLNQVLAVLDEMEMIGLDRERLKIFYLGIDATMVRILLREGCRVTVKIPKSYGSRIPMIMKRMRTLCHPTRNNFAQKLSFAKSLDDHSQLVLVHNSIYHMGSSLLDLNLAGRKCVIMDSRYRSVHGDINGEIFYKRGKDLFVRGCHDSLFKRLNWVKDLEMYSSELPCGTTNYLVRLFDRDLLQYADFDQKNRDDFKFILPGCTVLETGGVIVVEGEENFVVSKKLLGECIRKASFLDFSNKNKKTLMAKIKALLVDPRFKDEFTAESQIKLLPFLLAMTIQAVLRNRRRFDKLLDFSTNSRVTAYNGMFDTLYKHFYVCGYPIFWLDLLFILVLVLTVSLQVVLLHPIAVVVCLSVALGCFRRYGLFGVVLVACCNAILCSPTGYVYETGGFIFLFVFLLLWKYFRKKGVDYSAWYEFKRVVEIEYETLPYSCAVPFGDGFQELESRYDLRQVDINPRAYYKLYIHPEPKLEPKQGIVAVGPLFTTVVPGVYSTSTHNLYVGIMSRVLFDVGEPDEGVWAFADMFMDEPEIYSIDHNPVPKRKEFTIDYDGETYEFKFKPISRDYYLSRYPPVKRNNILRDYEKYKEGERASKHLVYKAFVKREKQMIISSATFEPQRPRIITGVSDLSKAKLGPWFLQYSYALKFAWSPLDRVFFCSGYTTDILNFWFNRAVDLLGGLVFFLGTDFSKYDLTQGSQCLNREYAWYERLGLKKHLGRLTKYKSSKIGSTVYSKVMKYSVEIKNSGDNDTSSGNSKNTGDVLRSFFLFIGILHLVFIAVLGDDNFTVLSQKVLEIISISRLTEELTVWSRRLGFRIKIAVTYDVLSTEFLSCKFYPTEQGYRVGKKPGRTMCKIGWFLKPNETRDKDEWLSIMKGTALSYLPTANHVPFLRVIVKFILSVTEGMDASITPDLKYLLTGRKTYEADQTTWAAFEKSYGLSEDLELEFEKDLIQHHQKFGLPFLMSSWMIDQLYAVDQLL